MARALEAVLPREMFVRSLYLFPLLAGLALAAPLEERAPPTIQLDQGTFVGTTDGTTTKFLGIPFAKAPSVFAVVLCPPCR